MNADDVMRRVRPGVVLEVVANSVNGGAGERRTVDSTIRSGFWFTSARSTALQWCAWPETLRFFPEDPDLFELDYTMAAFTLRMRFVAEPEPVHLLHARLEIRADTPEQAAVLAHAWARRHAEGQVRVLDVVTFD